MSLTPLLNQTDLFHQILTRTFSTMTLHVLAETPGNSPEFCVEPYLVESASGEKRAAWERAFGTAAIEMKELAPGNQCELGNQWNAHAGLTSNSWEHQFKLDEYVLHKEAVSFDTNGTFSVLAQSPKGTLKISSSLLSPYPAKLAVAYDFNVHSEGLKRKGSKDLPKVRLTDQIWKGMERHLKIPGVPLWKFMDDHNGQITPIERFPTLPEAIKDGIRIRALVVKGSNQEAALRKNPFVRGLWSYLTGTSLMTLEEVHSRLKQIDELIPGIPNKQNHEAYQQEDFELFHTAWTRLMDLQAELRGVFMTGALIGDFRSILRAAIRNTHQISQAIFDMSDLEWSKREHNTICAHLNLTRHLEQLIEATRAISS